MRRRDEIMKAARGPPGSYIRPEGNPIWVALGVVAALSFTLLGWCAVTTIFAFYTLMLFFTAAIRLVLLV